MIFLSQLIHVPIIDNKQEVIGKVEDLIIASNKEDYPALSSLVFQKKGRLFSIPYSCVENLSRAEVTLKKSNCWKEISESSDVGVFLARDVLDQQIFDVKGVRVVRVNDLQLGKIEEKFCAIGIDVSNKALIRRLGFSWAPFFGSIQSKFIDWKNISLVGGEMGALKLKTSSTGLKKLHPADIANLIENLTVHQSTKLVQSFDKETAAEVLGEVEPDYKDTLLERINSKQLATILEEMPTDEATDVIRDLSEHKKIQVFRRLGVRKAKVLHKLTSYRDDVAGGLMTSEYMAVLEGSTVGEAIQQIRKDSDEHRFIYHVLVVDNEKHLKGIVSMRTLMLAQPKTKILELMSKIIRTVRLNTKANEVARLMTKYNLLSLAVVDKHKVLHGIITVDDVLRLLVPDA